jgi:DNA polymerase-1
MKKLLYKELDLPKQYGLNAKKQKVVTCNGAALDKLYAKFPKIKALRLAKQLRDLRTLDETFMEIKLDPDGRIRTSYGITETGRLTSSKTVYETGANLQNQPSSIRNIYIPDPDKNFIIGDLGQADARVVACLAGEKSQIDLFAAGEDVYKFIGSQIYDKPENFITKEERDTCKTLVHATNYDVSARILAINLAIPLKEAKEYLRKYDRHFPNIKGVYHTNVQLQLQANRTLQNAFGRRRIFLDRWGPGLLKEAYNYLPQSTVADYLGTGMLRLEGLFPSGAEILLQIHDELVIQCYPKDNEEVIHLFRREVEKPVLINGQLLTIPLDIKVCKNWKEGK